MKVLQTFVWLFNTWLACMSGCAPKAMITDQDRAMQKAIEVVFPYTLTSFVLVAYNEKATNEVSVNR